MIDRHSTTTHAAYHDLMRSLLDERVSIIRGTPTRIERRGKAYWYDSFRIGSDVRKTYIGEETDELLARIDRVRDLRVEGEERRKHRTRLVRLLRAEGFQNMDAGTGSLLSALAGAGVFRLGGTVVGTHAFRLYEGTLGVRYRFDDMAQTGDIDIASFEQLSLALDDIVYPPLPDLLGGFLFAPVPSLDGGKVWRWRQSRNDLMVEFLTPSFSDEDGIRPLNALGVDAQALHHLNYLIAEPIKAVVTYRSGVLVQIPRPERFAIHKLIVADWTRKPTDALKSEKDRLQARFLIKILSEDRPDELHDAYTDARAVGPRWCARLDATLARMPEVKDMLEGM